MPDALAQRLVRGPFLIGIELTPPTSGDGAELADAARRAVQLGFELVSVTDQPLGRTRLDSLAMAELLAGSLAVPVLAHRATGSRSLAVLRSDAQRARDCGFALLLVSGDAPRVDGSVDSIAGLAACRDAAPDLLLLAAVDPAADDLGAELERAHRKIAAGARALVTQPVFDEVRLTRFLDDPRRPAVPLLLGVLPLRDAAHARRIGDALPDLRIDDPDRAHGAVAAAALVHAAATRVAGIHVMLPSGDLALARELLAACSATLR